MNRETYGKAYQLGFENTVRFLLSRGASWEGATETAQAAWARGWERVQQLRDEELVVRWVNTIALNTYRGLVRKELPLESSLEYLPKRTVHVAKINLAAIDVARILKTCRPRDRVLLEQQMYGLTPEEIAVEHGVTTTAIRIRLMRARREARLLLMGPQPECARKSRTVA